MVADEVRNLAQRAAQAAQNSASLAQEAVSSVETGVDVASLVAEKLQ